MPISSRERAQFFKAHPNFFKAEAADAIFNFDGSITACLMEIR
jgi:hypothetical protein